MDHIPHLRTLRILKRFVKSFDRHVIEQFPGWRNRVAANRGLIRDSIRFRVKIIRGPAVNIEWSEWPTDGERKIGCAYSLSGIERFHIIVIWPPRARTREREERID